MFPQQQDFAIRTFGLPGGAGFLGVCFGTVITANSPASQGASPTCWEATLWHEFCHVVTLNKTNNKMPRWLSEGISVYEERQADKTWGQTMTPQVSRDDAGRRSHAGQPAERQLSQPQDAAAFAVRVFRVVAGRRVPGREAWPRRRCSGCSSIWAWGCRSTSRSAAIPARSTRWTRSSPTMPASRPRRWPPRPIGPSPSCRGGRPPS